MTATEVQTRTLTVIEAVREALREEMERDDRVVLLGEDIGPLGGVFRATDGLLAQFGPERVIDTPRMELGIAGLAVGMAMRGLRPVAEIQFADFMHAAADHHPRRRKGIARGRDPPPRPGPVPRAQASAATTCSPSLPHAPPPD